MAIPRFSFHDRAQIALLALPHLCYLREEALHDAITGSRPIFLAKNRSRPVRGLI